jgi:hypothetical protein
MLTSTPPKMRSRVAAAAAIALASLTLSGGVAGALNFRSADNVSGHTVFASASHPSAGKTARVRHAHVRRLSSAPAPTTVGSNVAGGHLTFQ